MSTNCQSKPGGDRPAETEERLWKGGREMTPRNVKLDKQGRIIDAKPKDPIVAEWINQFVKLYEHSEAQEKRIEELADIAAGNGKDADDLEDDLRIARTRIAELEEREKRRSERIRQLDQENTNLCKAFSDDTGKQLARIKELEEKLRWRDCKTEPPTQTGAYIVKQTEDGQPWLDIFRVDIGWENAWNGGPVPHSWRPIE